MEEEKDHTPAIWNGGARMLFERLIVHCGEVVRGSKALHFVFIPRLYLIMPPLSPSNKGMMEPSERKKSRDGKGNPSGWGRGVGTRFSCFI